MQIDSDADGGEWEYPDLVEVMGLVYYLADTFEIISCRVCCFVREQRI